MSCETARRSPIIRSLAGRCWPVPEAHRLSIRRSVTSRRRYAGTVSSQNLLPLGYEPDDSCLPRFALSLVHALTWRGGAGRLWLAPFSLSRFGSFPRVPFTDPFTSQV
jgi:hypothetical protein